MVHLVPHLKSNLDISIRADYLDSFQRRMPVLNPDARKEPTEEGLFMGIPYSNSGKGLLIFQIDLQG